MSVGFIMLVHQSLERAAQVSGHWAGHGCPVAIHVDKRVRREEFEALKAKLADFGNVRFSDRFACEWGRFSIVEATLAVSERLLADFPEVGHIYVASGSCLPLRPVEDLRRYLEARSETDFIESVTTDDVHWTVGGLDRERFTLRFPFSWKRQRYLFDKHVELQRRIGFSRAIPDGLEPHLGSQWWCLTRATLSAILEDPRRPDHDGYFRRVWIPDESYFQTLARRHSKRIESRSLTLSKFDYQGKPHIFYDDHLPLLRRSDGFVARKIWPQAEGLYSAFLKADNAARPEVEPMPQKIDRIFTKAVELRTRGRPGLYMQSRFPNHDHENGKSCAAYSVFQGFGDVFEDFQTWLQKRTGSRIHGHLFDKGRVRFAGDETIFNGALSDSAKLRDYSPRDFLTNLIWNTQGERQCFFFGPDDGQGIAAFLASDQNAHISVIAGAWAVPLFHSGMEFPRVRKIAARRQRIEAQFLDLLRQPHTRARVRVWSLADFVEDPGEILQSVMDEMMPVMQRRLTEVPKLVDMTGFGQFLQDLKNEGMRPYLVGDFPADGRNEMAPPDRKAPSLGVVK
ncbi:glycosyl transferase [Maritimibacter sp. 55A14]|uniref:DUF5927 domain-containing protein n=1 Tax=Maritimibacter sp. 55A14 TaxID=2174844 RepID=UPI000D61B334|nr:beta-1,6-N-acetylglucosaminyltransferase [Maritimibacter sp. 55A14]PWE33587.1 glycosyl transferase [Maritimibacter sp. 55A14]